RHTRSKRDWSSDVCSSDLHPLLVVYAGLARAAELDRHRLPVLVQAVGVEAADPPGGGHDEQRVRLAVLGELVPAGLEVGLPLRRSEERRVGKEGRTGGGGT